jgi:hypothetical protein
MGMTTQRHGNTLTVLGGVKRAKDWAGIDSWEVGQSWLKQIAVGYRNKWSEL